MSDHKAFHQIQSQGQEGYSYRGWEFDSLLDMFSKDPEVLKEHLHKLLQSKVGPLNAFELGCGDGTLIREIKSMWGSVNGSEISLDDMRDEASRDFDNKLDIDYKVGRIEDYIDSVPNNSLDFIASRRTLEHLENPLFIFKKLYDKLAPNGEMYIHWAKIEESWSKQGEGGLKQFQLFIKYLRDSGIDISLIEGNYSKDLKLSSGRIIVRARKPKVEMNIDNVNYRAINKTLTHRTGQEYEVIQPKYEIMV
ncbi:MAG: class I SAM-dependent methyltransferase [Candidatus Dojkabacteria bacterium]